MTKQPVLTDFPLTVFATAKRRLQAAIRQSSAIINRRSLSGYAVLSEDIAAMVADAGDKAFFLGATGDLLGKDFLVGVGPVDLRDLLPGHFFFGLADRRGGDRFFEFVEAGSIVHRKSAHPAEFR